MKTIVNLDNTPDNTPGKGSFEVGGHSWGPKGGDHGAQRERTIFIDGYPSMNIIDGYPSMNINGYPVL